MEISEALKGFRYKKNLGQNFIADPNLLAAIVSDAGVGAEDTVVEIGVGAGTLTCALAARAKRVIGFEIDRDLAPILRKTLPEGVELHFLDVLRLKDDALFSLIEEPFSVVANLPYYITTPVIMRFLEGDIPLNSLTVMVQEEVARRLVAPAGSAEAGAITLQVALRGEARLTRMVGRRAFFPVPNVDSAVVHIDVHSIYLPEERERISRLIKVGFAMRRKTLLNNLIEGYRISREEAGEALRRAGLDANVRGEKLDTAAYAALAHVLAEMKKA